MNWQKLGMLRERFIANCDAMAGRYPGLATALRDYRCEHEYMIAADNAGLLLGKLVDGSVQIVPQRLLPAQAQEVLGKLFPRGQFDQPALIAGLDLGWLWHFAYELPASVPAAPGHRPPLYLLSRTIEQLFVALHVHDWRNLLADQRVRIFAGENAVEQALRHMSENAQVPLPKLGATVDPAIWPAGMNLDALNLAVLKHLGERLRRANDKITALYAGVEDASLAAKLRCGSLRILGITARYTTFLQHSMRDWLAAFDALGHETRLVIEDADHEQLNTLAVAEACAEFRPDLVLLIDHYRSELGGIPAKAPAVMWIQDYLPNIFDAKAGTAQGPYDYVIGYNRTECTTNFSYPFERFMPSMCVVNEDRFAPVQLSDEDRRKYECDICFVSHCTRPAEDIIREQIELNPQAQALLDDAFQRLRSIYDQGHFVSHPLHVKQVVEESCRATRMGLTADSLQRLIDCFTHRINNALFRHQMLDWAAETGAKMHLYGNGWESHPRFAKFAKGSADNGAQLRAIYRAAKVNLQATPHGAVHQRLLEGLCAGAFFLIRYVPGDMIERIYQPLWEWCLREGIESDQQIMQRATPEVFRLLGELQRTLGLDPFKLHMSLFDDLRTGADTGWVRSAGAIWPEYDHVMFDTRASLHQRISRFLSDDSERRAISESMRRRVIEKLTYKITTRRMLDFLGRDLATRATPKQAAA